MGKRVQFIRHTTGAADAFVGNEGEITVDKTAKELRVHDGLTAGGVATARKDLANVASATASTAGKMTASDKVELTAATTNVAQEIVNRVADVDAEEARAIAAEAVVQTNVDNEATTRGNADTTLQDNINSEASTRGSADTTLQTNIDGEATARSAADTVIQDQIDAMQLTRLNTVPIDIGDWNMDTTPSIAINFVPVPFAKVRGARAMIRNDNDTTRDDLFTWNANIVATSGETSVSDAVDPNECTITLQRTTGGNFDNTTFNATSYNRGWVIVEYTD